MPTRFVTFLMATAFFEQVTTSLIRVTTTYRAVELDLSVVWLGIITAAFAMLPIGLAGGDASIPPTQLLFWIGLGASGLSALSALMLRSPGTPTPPIEGSRPMPVRDILRLPGITILFLMSVVTVSAQDLVVVYLP